MNRWVKDDKKYSMGQGCNYHDEGYDQEKKLVQELDQDGGKVVIICYFPKIS